MNCRRCGSSNTNIYERYDEEVVVGHGCLWWILIGWWWWMICALLHWVGMIIAFFTTFPIKTIKEKHKYIYCRDCGYEEEID